MINQGKGERENSLLAEDSSDEPLQQGVAKRGQWTLLVMEIAGEVKAKKVVGFDPHW
jgi:hypothetical protein